MNSKKIKLNGKYLSDIISVLPTHCLLNKGITGCGGTTVELQSNRNSIILCPTRNLVTSKESQQYLGVDGNIRKIDIQNYLKNSFPYKKIIATYDALPKLMDSIPNYQEYFLLIDEYHLLFNDYSFRSEPIRFILDNFTKFNDWCFMTATPLKEEFILEELKDIDQITYVWENSIPVNITIKDTYFIQKSLFEYIDTFKDRNLHIFLNSISTIYNITKHLADSDYRVVCSETSKTKIKNFSKINSPVKRINFYTSCAFEGCDIYDPNGVCIIVCDTNVSTTILDISTKIRQVCGRLRDSKYKNQCYLILNTSKHRYAGTTKQEFEQSVKESEISGKERIRVYNESSEIYKNSELKTYNKDTYGTIYLNKKDNIIFYDENLKKMDIYNYNLISEIYSNSISIIGELNSYNFSLKKANSSCVNNIKPWILNNLQDREYTYQELETIFTPLFEQHGLKWNKNTSIKAHFPLFTKNRKTVNGHKDIFYKFQIC